MPTYDLIVDADLCGDGIVAFAMPPQYELGLLFEVL
jgi:hypothetical protein